MFKLAATVNWRNDMTFDSTLYIRKCTTRQWPGTICWRNPSHAADGQSSRRCRRQPTTSVAHAARCILLSCIRNNIITGDQPNSWENALVHGRFLQICPISQKTHAECLENSRKFSRALLPLISGCPRTTNRKKCKQTQWTHSKLI